MTRETKIGLLLGMGVILLIGIIISDQLAQPQQNPADFTGFAAETQRSIDGSDAASATAYTGAPTPPGTTPSGTSTVIEPPSDFFIPSNRQASPKPPRQVDGTPTGSPSAIKRPLTAYRIGESPGASRNPVDEVPTLRLGQNDAELPHQSDVTPTTPRTRTAALPSPRGADSVIRHKVLKGETLTKIARRYYSNGDYWRTIAQANPGKVTRDGQVQLGVVLNIPKRDDAALGQGFEPAGSERMVRVDNLNTRTDRRTRKTIEVQAGDTLSELASKHLGSANRWQDLLDANSDKLDDPQGLQVGMKLRLPGRVSGGLSGGLSGVAEGTQAGTVTRDRSSRPTRGGKTYTVRPGDNLTEIAERTLGDGGKWQLVYQANRDKLKSPDRLVVGQKLRIPAPG